MNTFHLDLFKQILKLNIGVAQADNSKMFKLLSAIYPLKLSKFPSGKEHNGWVIPHDWVVRKALIRKNGKVLFDGTIHPLAVVGYSCSFRGRISKQELDRHVFYRQELPDVYTYNFMNTYKPWAKSWGFSVPYKIYKKWSRGEYDIDLETEYHKGHMLVGECVHQGTLKDTIVFNAHTCHPAQFNDDLSGVAVILALFRWLSGQKTRYTYRAILGPEHFATIFYLAGLSKKELSRLKCGIFVEMVGIDAPFALQQSFTGGHRIDQTAEHALRQGGQKIRVGPFRSIVGNDETVWEAPGIEVPCISISRCYRSPHYYKEYHTNLDDLAITSESKLDDTLKALKNIVHIFEHDCTIQRNFKGLVALSNPKYGLYMQRPAPGIKRKFSAEELKMGRLQDILPRYFDGKNTIFGLARKFNLDFELLQRYIERFAKKGLVTLMPVKTLDTYQKE